MVATNSRPVELSEQFGGFARPQRTRHTVTEVDKLVHTSVLEIGKNRFKRKNVAMDIGEDRDTHDGTIPCTLHADIGILDQSGRTLVCRAYAKATATRRSHLNPPIGNRHPRLHRAHNEHPKPHKWAKSADEILSAQTLLPKAQNTLYSEL
jgi:hypothetical protein